MGLDIAAYSNLNYVGHHDKSAFDDEDCGYDHVSGERIHVEAYAYTEFPHALMGVPNVKPIPLGAEGVFIGGGCFTVTEATESHGFRAGSYSGYGMWREDLAHWFNPYRVDVDGSPSPEGPFYELLWFAGNEGTIATAACASLLADFRQHRDAYVAYQAGATYGDYNVQRYDDWIRAFELGAQSGLVDFH